VNEFLKWLDVFEFFNIFQFAFIPNCLYTMDYYDQLAGKVLGPTFVLLVCYFGFKLGNQRWMYEIFLVLSFVCYPSFCDSLFLFFDCKEYEDGENYLVMYPEIKCDDPKYESYRYPVAVMGFVLPFGIIALYFMELVGNRRRLCPQVLTPDEVTGDELEGIPRTVIGDVSPKSTRAAHLEPSKTLRASLHELTQTVLTCDEEIGVTKEELTKAFDAQKKDAGTDRAVEWLQIVLRDARGGAEHLKCPQLSTPDEVTDDELKRIPRAAIIAAAAFHRSGGHASGRKKDVGITKKELAEAFNAKEKRAGTKHAVEWLQTIIRDARGGAEHLRFLYASYKPEFYWFEAFEMIRKFTLTGLPLLTRLVSQESNTESVWGTLLSAAFTVYVNSVAPYNDENDQLLSLCTQFHLIATMVAGMGNGVMKPSDGSDIFIALAVVVPAVVLMAILVYGIIDPEYETWFARKCVLMFRQLQRQLQSCVTCCSPSDGGSNDEDNAAVESQAGLSDRFAKSSAVTTQINGKNQVAPASENPAQIGSKVVTVQPVLSTSAKGGEVTSATTSNASTKQRSEVDDGFPGSQGGGAELGSPGAGPVISAFQEDEDEKGEGSNSCLAKVTAGPTLPPAHGPCLTSTLLLPRATALPSVGGPTPQQVRAGLNLGDGADTSTTSVKPQLERRHVPDPAGIPSHTVEQSRRVSTSGRTMVRRKTADTDTADMEAKYDAGEIRSDSEQRKRSEWEYESSDEDEGDMRRTPQAEAKAKQSSVRSQPKLNQVTPIGRGLLTVPSTAEESELHSHARAAPGPRFY
jgi:hypothetical protein